MKLLYDNTTLFLTLLTYYLKRYAQRRKKLKLSQAQKWYKYLNDQK